VRAARGTLPGRHRSLARALTALLFLAFASASAAGANQAELQAPSGPRLLHYRLRCQAPRGCRIECFQAGVKVVATRTIATTDSTRLVVSDGIADDFTPRWFELHRGAGAEVETILLPSSVLCDLEGLTIEPLDGGG